MSHTWEIIETNKSKHLPSGFRIYEIGHIRIYKLINTETGSYKNIEAVSIAAKNKIINTEIEKLKSASRDIKQKHNSGSLRGIDVRNIINNINSLIKRFQNNDFEDLTFEIQTMLKENINGAKVNNYELLIDKSVFGFKRFWSEEYPKFEQYQIIFYEFKKRTLAALEDLENYIKLNKKIFKEIEPKEFNKLEDALTRYEIQLNSNSIIKKNHFFKKLISDENLLEENFKNHQTFTSWLSLKNILQEIVEYKTKLVNQKNEFVKTVKEINIKFEKYKATLNIVNESYVIELEDFLTRYERIIKNLNTSDIFSLNSELRKYYDSLNEYIRKIDNPKIVIEQFLENKSLKFLVIKGKAGTGKTTLIKQIIKTYYKDSSLLARFKEIINSKEIIVSAPTKVACANIRQRRIWHARTIQHILSNFENVYIEKTKILILDESSMIGTKLFNRINDKFQANILNGDLKIVFIGDSAQLTPVEDTTISPTLIKGQLESKYNKYFREGFINNGVGLEIELEIDYRLSNNFDAEYISFLEDLRNSKIDHKNVIKDLNKRLLLSNSVENVEEENPVVRFFNLWVDIGINVKDRLDSNESFEEILYSLNKRENFKKEKFTTSDIFTAFEIYKSQKDYRPKLVELYSKYYPKVNQRIENPKNLNTVMSLFRTNNQVAHVNMNIRNYLFEHELNNDDYICKGEVLRVEATAYDESLYDDERLYRGDTFIVVSDPIKINEDFHIVKIRQVNRNILNPVKLFFDKYLNSEKVSEIVVWTAGLKILNESNGKYLEDKKLKEQFHESIKKSLLTAEQHLIEKLKDSYSVSYDYAKVTHASQGGEWDNIIIQSGDVWTNTKDSHRYLYTAFTRARKKVYLYS